MLINSSEELKKWLLTLNISVDKLGGLFNEYVPEGEFII